MPRVLIQFGVLSVEDVIVLSRLQISLLYKIQTVIRSVVCLLDTGYVLSSCRRIFAMAMAVLRSRAIAGC